MVNAGSTEVVMFLGRASDRPVSELINVVKDHPGQRCEGSGMAVVPLRAWGMV